MRKLKLILFHVCICLCVFDSVCNACVTRNCLSFLQHFVSERKYDEDLGRVARFTCDVETLKQSIDSFGQGEREGERFWTMGAKETVLGW